MDLFEQLGLRPAWQRDALCREYPDVNWFPESGESPREAAEVCSRCLVADTCREYALSLGPSTHGVWAGTTQRSRTKLLSGRRATATATCQGCGDTMPAGTARKKFCTPACGQRYYYRNRSSRAA